MTKEERIAQIELAAELEELRDAIQRIIERLLTGQPIPEREAL